MIIGAEDIKDPSLYRIDRGEVTPAAATSDEVWCPHCSGHPKLGRPAGGFKCDRVFTNRNTPLPHRLYIGWGLIVV
jgi:hypothetical protein